ncbi:hypothetical protein AWE51_00220 [Aquimarina aggregata]|uniref:Uncharacterized protein n=1 Tax=Aquimarina aggregata TaxID=1642818 RepID=A0A163BYV0_9FLAO|nr:hypothetical protein [Aquimarina aggregata]KZS41906.1 hypothetical protein AWE51_00220 [Aquimarina aggregata]
MKYKLICPICVPDPTKGVAAVTAEGDINNDFIAVCKCSKEHVSICFQEDYRFEFLYYSAIQSMVSGNLSESVLSFSAALERVFELFIKVNLINYKIPYEDIKKYWKELGLSERQYGAFCTLYFMIAKKEWRENGNMKNFRNKIVHKGYIATTKEVEKYASYIVDKINDVTVWLIENLRDSLLIYEQIIKEERLLKVKELCKRHKVDFYCWTHGENTLFFFDQNNKHMRLDFNQIMINWNNLPPLTDKQKLYKVQNIVKFK